MAETVVLVVAVLLIAAAAWQVLRRMVISRRGGVIDCGLRAAGASWRYGLAVCERGELCWYRSPGLRLRPDARFGRAQLRLGRSRQPSAGESAQLGPGLVIAECDTAAGRGIDPRKPRSPVLPVGVARRAPHARAGMLLPHAVNGHVPTAELAMSELALTGLLAWLEAAPRQQSERWLGRPWSARGLRLAVG